MSDWIFLQQKWVNTIPVSCHLSLLICKAIPWKANPVTMGFHYSIHKIKALSSHFLHTRLCPQLLSLTAWVQGQQDWLFSSHLLNQRRASLLAVFMGIRNDILDDLLASKLNQLNLLLVLGIYTTLPEFWNRKVVCEK